MELVSTQYKLGFLQGGGEMGALTRAYNWEKTTLGSPFIWQQSLRTTLGILLHSAFPMFLFWGPEYLCFYNDAYRPSLGNNGKHPCVGKPGKEVWPEIWDFIGPLIIQVMATGEPAWFEDQLLPIFRNGQLEDVYWTFSYSPAYGDSGEIGGVLVTCTETTKAVVERQRLVESENRFRNMVAQIPVGITVMRGDDFIMESMNEAMLRFINRDASVIGKPMLEEFPEIKSQDVWPLVQKVYEKGEQLMIDSVPVSLNQDGQLVRGYYDISYTPLQTAGKTEGVLQVVQDVTTQVIAQQQLHKSAQRFRAAIDAVQGILWTNDAQGKMIGEQPGWASLTGQSFEEYQRYGWAEAVHLDDAQSTIEAWEKAVNGRTTFVHEHRVHRADGSWGNYAIRAIPLLDEAGEITEWVGIHTDITEQRRAAQALQESEARFSALIEEAPVATCLFVGREMRIEIANTAMIAHMGKGADVIGKPLLEALPEMQDQTFLHILNSIYDSGETVESKAVPVTLLVEGIARHKYFDYTFKPLRNADGEVWAIINMSVDVTEQVAARQRIERSQRQLLASFEQSPVGIAILDKDEGLTFRIANAFYSTLVGRTPQEIIDKPLLEALPELTGQGFETLLRGVINSGVPYIANEVAADIMRNDRIERIYVDLAYQPRLDDDGSISGVLVVATDVTGQVRSRQVVQESEERLRNVVESAPLPIGIYVGRELRIQFANQAIINIFGKGPDVVGKLYTELVPELEDSGIFEQLRSVIDTGTAIHMRNQRVSLLAHGAMREYYFNYSFTPLHDAAGKVYAVMNTAADVTDVVRSKQKIEEAEASLRGAVELAELGTWEIDLVAGLLDYDARTRKWFGIGPDEIITPERAYRAVREVDRPRINDAIQHAIAPASNGIYDIEYTVDTADGHERILHAQGKAFHNEAGAAYKLMGTVQDVTAIRHRQAALEREVQERTAELAAKAEELVAVNNNLQRSNEELAQYAYVASHDLQEPLRKIRVFSGMLDKQSELGQMSRGLVHKVDAASQRMAMLIKDLLEFSRLLNSESLVRPIDLNEVCQAVVSDFELSINERAAQVRIGPLPRIHGVGLQMNQLFYNLLSNALKFSKPDETPRIEIESRPMMPAELRQYIAAPNTNWLYYDITIRDNGIGFEQKYSEQIFEVFKRLHGRDIYPGSGIGLALCRRIAGNAHGYLYAESKQGAGSTFHIILPDRLR